MTNTTEQEKREVFNVQGRITRMKVLDGDDAVEIFFIPSETKNPDDLKFFQIERFPIVRASKLSLRDNFLKYNPKTIRQKNLKKLILNVIKIKIKDFRCSVMDPTYENGIIIYQMGKDSAVGNSAKFWDKKLKKLMPEKNSRMGNILEYAAFLGCLIKYLIEKEGYSVDMAWKAVCDDSKELGHYRNSKDAKNTFEKTGSRKIGKFYDLANTSKIVVDKYSDSGYSIVGGNAFVNGEDYPLAHINENVEPYNEFFIAIGWMVCDV